MRKYSEFSKHRSFRRAPRGPVSPSSTLHCMHVWSAGEEVIWRRFSVPRVVLGSRLGVRTPVAKSSPHVGSNHTGQQCQRGAIAIRTGSTGRGDDTRHGTKRHLYHGGEDTKVIASSRPCTSLLTFRTCFRISQTPLRAPCRKRS